MWSRRPVSVRTSETGFWPTPSQCEGRSRLLAARARRDRRHRRVHGGWSRRFHGGPYPDVPWRQIAGMRDSSPMTQDLERDRGVHPRRWPARRPDGSPPRERSRSWSGSRRSVARPPICAATVVRSSSPRPCIGGAGEGARHRSIEPGAPWQNPFVESYKWHLRKELLDLDPLDLVLEAQVLIDDWREEYKTTAPTSRAAPSRRWSSPAGGGWRTKPESQIWWTDEKGRVRGWRNDQLV